MFKGHGVRILIVVYHPIGGIRTYFRDVYGQSVFEEYKCTIITLEDYVSNLQLHGYIV